MIALIKKIEKQKIHIAELFIARQRRLATLQALSEERHDKEMELAARRAVSESILLNNKSFLYQVRQIIALCHVLVVCQTDADT